MSAYKLTRTLLGALFLALFWFWADGTQAGAEHVTQIRPTPAAAVNGQGPISGTEPNANCLMCHSDPDFKGATEDGELTTLSISGGAYRQSVHGKAGLECIACHLSISDYPHHDEEQVGCTECHDLESGSFAEPATIRATLPFSSSRELSLTINEACRTCHEHEFEVAADSAHVAVFQSGNLASPVCVDCHGSHDITPPDKPRAKISQSCGACHQAVYSSYRYSVHGAALEEESNPDVPTCIDCHGVHSVHGPRDEAFRTDSIAVCGDCHSNRPLMAKYNISADVLDTYLNDFHGRTVELFRHRQAGSVNDKAVCFDCHGIHNVQRPDDPSSSVYPANLQHTCQKCHEDANIRFPEAWLSHYLPTWEDTPILFAVDWIYRLLIPLTIGGFALYIGLDANKRWGDKRKIMRKALSEEASTDEFDDSAETD